MPDSLESVVAFATSSPFALAPDELAEEIRLALRQANSIEGGTYAEQLWLLTGEIESRIARLREVKAAVRQLQAEDIRRHGPIRFADKVIYTTPKKDRTFADDGPKSLLAWAIANEVPIDDLFNLSPRYVRIRAFRAHAERIAAGKEMTEAETAEYVALLEQTLFEVEEGEWEVVERPAGDSRWAQVLNHGERKPK